MQKIKWPVLLSFAAIYIIWGSTYLAILFGLKSIPPLILAGTRFLVAGILLYVWALVKHHPQPGKKSLGVNAIGGILMLFGGTASVTWSEQYLPSSIAAIIVTALPFWFILLDKKQWRFYFSNKLIIAGLLVGFAGMLVLVCFDKPHQQTTVTAAQKTWGTIVILAGGIAWTMGSLYSKYKPTGNSLVMNASLQLLSAGIFSLLVAATLGEWHNFSWAAIESVSWLGLWYLVIMGSLVTYLCYLYLLNSRPAALVNTYVYINPVVALLLGAAFMDEHITVLKVIALVIILAGVLLVNLPKYKGKEK